MRASWGRLAAAASLWLVPSAAARGQSALLDQIGIEERLGASVPLDAEFRDEAGEMVTLGELLDGKPAILALVYYHCPMLCGEVLEGLAHALTVVPLRPAEDFRFIAVSFDPAEGPEDAARVRIEKRALNRKLGGAEGSRFLTGSPESIRALTEAAGFRYVASGDRSQFAHASGFLVLTPEGRISRYFYGIEYAPRDLRLALVEAAELRIGSAVDRLLLYCYQYDPATGRYGLMVMRVLRVSAATTTAALVALIGIALMRERKRGQAPIPAGDASAEPQRPRASWLPAEKRTRTGD